MRETRLILSVLTAFILCLSGMEGRAETPGRDKLYFSVYPADDNADMPMDAIAVQNLRHKYFLFLPGNANMQGLRIWFDESLTAEQDGSVFHSGDRFTAIVPGEMFSVRVGRKQYDILPVAGSAIPAVFISSETGNMKKIDGSKKYKEKGKMKIITGDGIVCYEGDLEHIKLRGQSSTKFEKKSYTVKLAEKTDLFMMGKAKKWVLTGNTRDHSLLRNQITLAMASKAGLRYTPECIQTEVYLNHEYNGTYLLQEKIEITSSRINIRDLEKATQALNEEELDNYAGKGPGKPKEGQFKYKDIPINPDDITGGYLIEYEYNKSRYNEEPCAYMTKRRRTIVVKEPGNATRAQMNYISGFIQGFENAIFSENGLDPESGKHYSEFVDMDSLVLKYMLEEITKNLDGNSSSQYFYKPEDKISTVAYAGPAWDYDNSYGSFGESWTRKVIRPEGLWVGAKTKLNYWWPRLYAKKDFREKVYDMWQERYAEALQILLGIKKDPDEKLMSVYEYAESVRVSAEMNFIRWPIRYGETNVARTGESFEENISYLVKFIRGRYRFLNGEWGDPTLQLPEEQ